MIGPGEVTSLKTGTRLKRLFANVWEFIRTMDRPVFSLSEFKSYAEILRAGIGMAFGNSWRSDRSKNVSVRLKSN
jgi:hypothetical protein